MDHHLNLRFPRMADANDGFLDPIGGILRDRQSRQRRCEQYDTARLAELQGRGWVFVDEGFLDSRFVRLVEREHFGQAFVQSSQPPGQWIGPRRTDSAVRDMGQSIARDINNPPARVLESGIKPDHAYGAVGAQAAVNRSMMSSAIS